MATSLFSKCAVGLLAAAPLGVMSVNEARAQMQAPGMRSPAPGSYGQGQGQAPVARPLPPRPSNPYEWQLRAAPVYCQVCGQWHCPTQAPAPPPPYPDPSRYPAPPPYPYPGSPTPGPVPAPPPYLYPGSPTPAFVPADDPNQDQAPALDFAAPAYPAPAAPGFRGL